MYVVLPSVTWSGRIFDDGNDINTQARVLPGFLAWQINQEPIQQYLQKSSHGSMVQAIGRQELENMQLAIPPLEKQHAIVALNKTWQRLPESRLQGRIELAIPGLDTRFPAGMTAFVYNDERLCVGTIGGM